MSTQKQTNGKRSAPRQEPSSFQFSDLTFEEPKVENVVVQPVDSKRPTGPWSDDLTQDRDDPSWTVVVRKKRRTNPK